MLSGLAFVCYAKRIDFFFFFLAVLFVKPVSCAARDYKMSHIFTRIFETMKIL